MIVLKKILLITAMVLMAVLMLSMVFALTANEIGSTSFDVDTALDEFFKADGTLKTQYKSQIPVINEQIKQVPEVIMGIFGNENLNIYIDLENGQQLKFGVITKDNKLVDIKRKELDEPTMKVTTSETAIKEIATSSDPMTAAINALNSGKIKYEGVGIVNSVKSLVINTAISVLNIVASVVGFLMSLFGMVTLAAG